MSEGMRRLVGKKNLKKKVYSTSWREPGKKAFGKQCLRGGEKKI